MKEIVIQSESDDLSSDDVISWIKHIDNSIHLNKFFDNYLINDISLKLTNKNRLETVVNGVKINSKTNMWYRRGQLIGFDENNPNNKEIHRKINLETIKPIVDFLNSGISTNHINKFEDNFANKLKMLETALLCGIKIPDLLITGNSKELLEFLDENKKVITKPIKNPFINFKFNNHIIKFSTHSKLITKEDVRIEEFYFLPSFFQKYIEKKYEIRTFYIDGVFKSMAIFSQQNEKTKIDFRNYDKLRPNRCVPYQLPKNLEKKLKKFMQKMNINCGSFDIILTPKNEYVFLEVNPIGQFQWVSLNCNYFLEKLIAQKILNNEN